MPLRDVVPHAGMAWPRHVPSSTVGCTGALRAQHRYRASSPWRAGGEPQLSAGSESLSNLARSPGRHAEPPAVPALLPGLPADGMHVCMHVQPAPLPRCPAVRPQPARSTPAVLPKPTGVHPAELVLLQHPGVATLRLAVALAWDRSDARGSRAGGGGQADGGDNGKRRWGLSDGGSPRRERAVPLRARTSRGACRPHPPPPYQLLLLKVLLGREHVRLSGCAVTPFAGTKLPGSSPRLESPHPAGRAGLSLSQGKAVAGMGGVACRCRRRDFGEPCRGRGDGLRLPRRVAAALAVAEGPFSCARISFDSPVSLGEKTFRKRRKPNCSGSEELG